MNVGIGYLLTALFNVADLGISRGTNATSPQRCETQAYLPGGRHGMRLWRDCIYIVLRYMPIASGATPNRRSAELKRASTTAADSHRSTRAGLSRRGRPGTAVRQSSADRRQFSLAHTRSELSRLTGFQSAVFRNLVCPPPTPVAASAVGSSLNSGANHSLFMFAPPVSEEQAGLRCL